MSSEQTVPQSNTGSVPSILSLCSKVTLDGSNYNDWICNIRMALRFEHKEYVLETELVDVDPDTATPEEIASYTKHSDDATKVACIMITTMSPELQRIYEDYWPYEMHRELAEKFRKQERIERREVVKAFTNGKPRDGESICTHVQRMQGYIERLRKLEMPVHEDLAVDIVLNSLRSSYDQFTLAYHLNNSQATLAELHRMLRTAEDGMKGKSVLPVNPPVLAIGSGKGKKRKGPPKQHWREKTHVGSSSNAPRAKSSSIPHGLEESRNLEHGKLNLVMGNRRTLPVTKIGVYGLMLSSGVRLDLNNCCYAPDMAKNIISFHALFRQEKACLWHCRLGHINKKRIAQLQNDGVLESFDLGSDDNKSDTFEKFKEFKNEAENQLGRKIKMLRSDRGGEYLSIEFLDYLKECGIVSQLSPPRTPQLNGVAERRNRTLLDMVRSMMTRASLPIHFWGYALETAAHILNLVPTKKVAKTPHEMWTGKVPSLAHIKVWGCEAFVRRDTSDKLSERSERYFFVGYPKQCFGYLFYRPSEDVVFVARRGFFREKELISKEDSGSTIDLEEIQEMTDEPTLAETSHQHEEEVPVGPTDISLPLRRSGRVSMPPEFYGFHITSDGDTLAPSLLNGKRQWTAR
ncbi:hypothetical protein L1887_02255 [Cichorium endivia]|nr:hypothetical protein L1887_02255 [Cichorium endivia]